MLPTTKCSETSQRIQQVIHSLQHLSQRVLPDMKQVTGCMQSGESACVAASHEALMLETHKVIGSAIKELGSILKSHRLADDANDITQPKKPVASEIELESLRFFARADLDKLQLVSKAKKALVETQSDRLALHKIFRVSARHEESRCRILYQIQLSYSGVRTLVQEAFTPERDNDQEEQLPVQPNPFRRMRNAFVGAVHFDYAGNMSSKFKALLSEFLRQQKGALKNTRTIV
ncbi:hypothetical protein AAVH_27419 [Aphelenchoides avenae]|nr:hypothetical protein AAVH_27419 [Aphelenchus avenae]